MEFTNRKQPFPKDSISIGLTNEEKGNTIIVKFWHAPGMPTKRIQLVEIPTDCHEGLSPVGGSLFMVVSS